MSLLYESKDIGPIPCSSPNLVLDLHIDLNDPLNQIINERYGVKKNLFAAEWTSNIKMEIQSKVSSLKGAIYFKMRLFQCITIFCIILLFNPIILYYFGNFDLMHLITISIVSDICLLIIICLFGWFWLYGITKKFRKHFVKKILKTYVNELSLRYEQFNFTILYPVIFYLSTEKENNDDPTKQIYCILRISDGIIYCSDAEPILFTTSDAMKEIHSKYKLNQQKEDGSSINGDYISNTPKSETSNAPILHQMKQDNRNNYSILSPFKNNSTPIVNKFNFNNDSQ